MLYIKLTAMALIGSILMFLTGCAPQQAHPNQLNSFDGASYDSLTVAHAAMVSMRASISSKYPQYAPAFDEAAASYTVAYNAYAAYRSAPTDQASLALALSNLTVGIVALENTFQNDLHVSPATVTNVRGRAIKMRAALQPKLTISDVLSELEIAATIAEAVPATEPYSSLAAIVIQTTQQAVAAMQSASGQPIDLTTIQPVPAI